MINTVIGIFFLFLTFLSFSAQARVGPKVILIPGAGTSAGTVHLDYVGWMLPYLGYSEYFGKFKEALDNENIPNFICPKRKDEDQSSISERTEDCVQAILETNSSCKTKNLILIGHSMGGLVARKLAADPRTKNCVHSVVSISTPHQGTPIADLSLEAQSFSILNFHSIISYLFNFTPEKRRYLKDVAIHADHQIFDDPKISYYSISTSSDPNSVYILEFANRIIKTELKKRGLDKTPFGTKNDGLVPEYSMVHGIHLGHLDVNHWASACIGAVENTDECRKTTEFLIPKIKSIFLKINSQDP